MQYDKLSLTEAVDGFTRARFVEYYALLAVNAAEDGLIEDYQAAYRTAINAKLEQFAYLPTLLTLRRVKRFMVYRTAGKLAEQASTAPQLMRSMWFYCLRNDKALIAYLTMSTEDMIAAYAAFTYGVVGSAFANFADHAASNLVHWRNKTANEDASRDENE